MIVDATGAVMGRIASAVAKKLLNGENIIIINAEKSVISGQKSVVYERYLHKRERGDRAKGPFYPRYPDKIMIRVIRGMVPRKKFMGRAALKRLKVFIGNPENYKKAEKIVKGVDELRCKYITLNDMSKRMGAKV